MSIKTRKIFYISGFDPRGPNHYHTLYRAEAEKFAALTGDNINVFNRKHVSKLETSWQIERAGVKTDYSFLRWDDIVRDNWEKKPWPLFIKSLKTYATIARNYDWKTALRWQIRPLITIIFPIILMMLLIWAVMHGWNIVQNISSWWIIQLPVLAGLIWFAAKIYTKLKAPWILRSLIANHAYLFDDKDLLDTRHADFAALIQTAAATKQYDEITVIAHSYGSMFLAPVIAKLSQSGANLKDLNIISLGQCGSIATLYNTPHYTDYLQTAAAQDIAWYDITSPADASAWSFTGAYKLCRHVPENDIQNTLVNISPRFHTMYDAEGYKKLRWNKYVYHFLYLTCPDSLIENSYNYFDLTSGSLSCDDYTASLKGKDI